ncbi:phenylacetate-CoA ligase [Peribacillus deserti]|uniref:Phenylacetate-CoA ligase n=1 Tax=Peribacillus deserti TaxID=673318 RepID=A0ABS2QCB7_9BACI|nr:AMP-binding protein [Peribacillus deserti]MBM7690778.1 phenylacetate-CoA ligase [Peribacillus deserti]
MIELIRLKNFVNKLYLSSPFLVKRIFANAEALRRDRYRRFDKSEQVDFQKNMLERTSYFNVEQINDFIKDAADNVEYYAFLRGCRIESVKDFEQIPLLTKQIIREAMEKLISKKVKNKKELWAGSSSGSTGMPLKYYRDKQSINIERLQYDAFYKYCGCDTNNKRVRISGVKVAKFDRQKPPFWLYIDKYKQLQCSAYHISENSFRDYIKAIKKIGPAFATGFPSGWAALAELMIEDGSKYNGFKAIITDSEGLSTEQQKKIEKAFNCRVYQTYGLGEVGMCAVQCEKSHYHILPTYYVEVVDNEGKTVEDGTEGEIVVTDYYSRSYPFIRYGTGDLGIMRHDDCGCGIKTPYLTEIIGRIEDYILTKDGRKVKRLSLIVKPAIGIRESQIIQVSKDQIVINVVPDVNFDEESMKNVIETAKEFVGDMNISWKAVDKLERMQSGKLKFLIRKF